MPEARLSRTVRKCDIEFVTSVPLTLPDQVECFICYRRIAVMRDKDVTDICVANKLRKMPHLFGFYVDNCPIEQLLLYT